ncbi:hypothetical protein M514_13915 [Trichuris suis]|uniref:Uncharacterized protein n=1 Tax=Trichuris suis TaxID=68888 RepID=A0A085LJR1_9BILA|nr:hypothetical protein M513_13915 [Trichuris suis]KFD59558.1 hypothetical protein M514_13915 [Trichuris suis]
MELARNEPAWVVGSGKAHEGLGLRRVCPRAAANAEETLRACGRPTVPNVRLDESAFLIVGQAFKAKLLESGERFGLTLRVKDEISEGN